MGNEEILHVTPKRYSLNPAPYTLKLRGTYRNTYYSFVVNHQTAKIIVVSALPLSTV